MCKTIVVPQELLVSNYSNILTPLTQYGNYALKEGEYNRLFPQLPEALGAFIHGNNVNVAELPDDMIIGASIVDTDIYTVKMLRHSIDNEKRIDDINRKALTENVFNSMIQSMLENHDSYHPATYLEEEFD